MDIVLIVAGVLVAFMIGLVIGRQLSRSVIVDLCGLLERLLENPNDEDVRATVCKALYQGKRKSSQN
jgi:hypothetical protein